MTAGRDVSPARLISPTNAHPASRLHPASDDPAPTGLDVFRTAARLAEPGRFDLFFVADTRTAPAGRHRLERRLGQERASSGVPSGAA